jgi:hypothetical protein
LFFYVRAFGENEFVATAQTPSHIVKNQDHQVKVSDRISHERFFEFAMISGLFRSRQDFKA